MTDVRIPFGDNASDRATLLLGAAASLKLDSSVVATVTGAFLVDEKVASKAGFDAEGNPAKSSPAKKAPAKKAAAKKKTTAKKIAKKAASPPAPAPAEVKDKE